MAPGACLQPCGTSLHLLGAVREYDRTLRSEPKLEKSSTDKVEPRRQRPKTDRDDPSRAMLRIESAEPICTKSSTDSVEPSRHMPYTLSVLPKRAKYFGLKYQVYGAGDEDLSCGGGEAAQESFSREDAEEPLLAA